VNTIVGSAEVSESQNASEYLENVKEVVAIKNGSDLVSSVINHFPQYQLSSSPNDLSSPDKA